MADYDRDLVASIAGAVSAYVHDAEPEDVAIDVLTDLEAEGWEFRHPNDADGGSYEPEPASAGSSGSAGRSSPSTEATRPAAKPWDFFRYRRRGPSS
jgi:hypothetical protein